MSFRGSADVPESYRIDEFRKALRAVSISVSYWRFSSESGNDDFSTRFGRTREPRHSWIPRSVCAALTRRRLWPRQQPFKRF